MFHTDDLMSINKMKLIAQESGSLFAFRYAMEEIGWDSEVIESFIKQYDINDSNDAESLLCIAVVESELANFAMSQN